MSRPKLLTELEINHYLNEVQLWQRDGSYIIREIHGPNFVSIIGFINSIAVLAEKMDHHPDLNIYGWNKLKITLSTHDAGGLTELDFKLAGLIDEIGFNHLAL